jgi:hypothetical protein
MLWVENDTFISVLLRHFPEPAVSLTRSRTAFSRCNLFTQ